MAARESALALVAPTAMYVTEGPPAPKVARGATIAGRLIQAKGTSCALPGRWKPQSSNGVSTLRRLPCFFNDHLHLHYEDYLMLANDSFMHSFRKHTDVLA